MSTPITPRIPRTDGGSFSGHIEIPSSYFRQRPLEEADPCLLTADSAT